MAQTLPACISLTGSRLCPAFNESFVAVQQSDKFPFLNNITTVSEFDDQLQTYLNGDHVRQKYDVLFNCSSSGPEIGNVTDVFCARWTRTVMCASIVQESLEPCQLSEDLSQPVCVDTCAQWATSEESIVVNSTLCPSSSTSSVLPLIRADFVVCSTPANSLPSLRCIEGLENEPDNCGFGTNTAQLCQFCLSGSSNAIACCNGMDLSSCGGYQATATSSTPLLASASASAVPSTEAASNKSLDTWPTNMTSGKIVGIVLGCAAFTALVVGLIAFCCIKRLLKHRDQKDMDESAEKPARGDVYPISPMYYDHPLDHHVVGRGPPGEGRQGGTPDSAAGPHDLAHRPTQRPFPITIPQGDNASEPSIITSRSTSTSAALLDRVKDHYSERLIEPGSKVCALWGYTPHLADEMYLVRGDTITITAIWHDGWATGIKTSRGEGKRASAWSATTAGGADNTRAFPMVCVCHAAEYDGILVKDEASGGTSRRVSPSVTATATPVRPAKAILMSATHTFGNPTRDHHAMSRSSPQPAALTRTLTIDTLPERRSGESRFREVFSKSSSEGSPLHGEAY